jgi:hypothetical protein
MGKKKFICECGKGFTRNTSLSRHMETACINKIINSNNNNNNNSNNNNSKNSNNNNNNNNKNSNNNNNNNNNTKNIIPINMLVNITINVVPAEKENINDLSITEWGKIFTSDTNVFMEIIMRVNCLNPLHHNIYYNDVKSGYGYIYTKGELKQDRIQNILNNFIDKRMMDIQMIINVWGKIWDPNNLMYLFSMLEKIEKNLTKRNKLISNLKTMLNDFSNKILITMKHNNIYNKKYLKMNKIIDEEKQEDIDFEIEDFDSDSETKNNNGAEKKLEESDSDDEIKKVFSSKSKKKLLKKEKK